MKKQLTIYKTVGAACTVVIFGSIFLFNLTAFGSKDSRQNVRLTDLLSKAYADDESGGSLKWSRPIDCAGSFTGDYLVCNQNGYGNSCSTPGATTCTCGVNCD